MHIQIRARLAFALHWSIFVVSCELLKSFIDFWFREVALFDPTFFSARRA